MSQVNPVGPHPSADVMFVGALLWAPYADAEAVLNLVHDDDLESVALAEVLAAIRRLVGAGKAHAAQMVLDELTRTGRVHAHNGVAGQLQAALTSGAVGEMAWDVGGAVVARSLRRRVDAAGVALQQAARDASETELSCQVSTLARTIGDCTLRLARLRGDAL